MRPVRWTMALMMAIAMASAVASRSPAACRAVSAPVDRLKTRRWCSRRPRAPGVATEQIHQVERRATGAAGQRAGRHAGFPAHATWKSRALKTVDDQVHCCVNIPGRRRAF